jgi:uncharacterized protein
MEPYRFTADGEVLQSVSKADQNQIMELIAGYIAACLIGVCLGMIGAGGSILTMPVLVFLFHVDPTIATAYSLFIVGATALAGAIRNAASGMVDFRTVLVFGLPSLIGTYITRRYIIPAVPNVIYSTEAFSITRNVGIMLFFSIMMLAAGLSMVRRGIQSGPPSNDPLSTGILGLLVGILTGIVGAGGGFLIIPSLVLFAGLPMKRAVGTSLAVIAMKSLLGFGGDMLSGLSIDYALMLSVAAIAIVGIFVGSYLSTRVAAEGLKDGFGWFVIVMSIVIIGQQVASVY